MKVIENTDFVIKVTSACAFSQHVRFSQPVAFSQHFFQLPHIFWDGGGRKEEVRDREGERRREKEEKQGEGRRLT